MAHGWAAAWPLVRNWPDGLSLQRCAGLHELHVARQRRRQDLRPHDGIAKPLNSDAVLIQRGTALQGAGPSGQSGTGLAWTSRYAVVGMNAVGVDDMTVNGMNEHGMAGGLLFRWVCPVSRGSTAEADRSIASWQLLTYVSNFESIAEVKQALPGILVNGSVLQAFGGRVPIHMTLRPLGQSLSVEYIKVSSACSMTTGVYTNDPPFPYHPQLPVMPPISVPCLPLRCVNGLNLPPASSGPACGAWRFCHVALIRALIISRNAPTA